MYEEIRIAIDVVSAIMCFVLVWFMAKPYSLTGEHRYIGLPVGFFFLGLSSVVMIIAILIPNYFTSELSWLQLLPRTFAFLFLAVTYYFSNSLKKSQLMWDFSISFLFLVLVTLCVFLVVNPDFASLASYFTLGFYFRIFNLISLFYISIHTLRNHMKSLESSTFLIPFGFILFAIGQYSIMIFLFDRTLFAFWGALALRLAALIVFLYIAYKAFYSSNGGIMNEKDASQR
jgi:hypothetical protein